MRTVLATVALLACGPALADYKTKDGRVIECFCTDRQGQRRNLGEIICITVGQRSYMAKCEMAQNVPHWRDQGYGCLSSENRQQPAMTPRPRDAAFLR